MSSGVFTESLPLGDLLVRSALRHPDRVALAFPDREYTYRELLDSAVETARGLIALGIRPGDHVGLLMPNSPEFVEGYFAAALVGAVLVPLNARFRSAELSYVVDHAEIAVLLTTDSIAGRTDFRAILTDGFPSIKGSERRGEPLELPEAEHLRHIVMLRGESSAGFVGAQEFAAAGRTVETDEVWRRRERIRVRDIAMILYTSGTTAHPKGCLITHESITRGSVGRAAENIPFVEPLEDRAIWCPLPLFHIASMQSFLSSIAQGATFLTDVFFDGDRAIAQITRYRATSIWPWFMATMNGVLNHPDFDAAALAHVTSIILVGPPSELRRVQGLFPQAALINGSGMSEMAGYYCMSPLEDTAEQRATNAGKAVSGTESRVIDPETGLDAEPGELGELLLRGYSMMVGYFKDPERTAEAVDTEGWLHTGDLFRREADGHLVYEGRLKDMLKVGGENVPAVEVEAFLCTHPAVLLAEVVARPDDRLDEVPVAFVELVEGAMVTDEEIIEYCRGKISSFKVPRAVFFKTSTEWPMSSTKVDKVSLRREALERSMQNV
ncbi:class I adenylate-forming enzyme family protein [Microbacterium sp. KHB019]|uniref:class I adenylate-forming enzyme family protein n=1 Tax=Microbacterium sp. KHB019 TaxID=3129770 RepID=UPI003078F07A